MGSSEVARLRCLSTLSVQSVPTREKRPISDSGRRPKRQERRRRRSTNRKLQNTVDIGITLSSPLPLTCISSR